MSTKKGPAALLPVWFWSPLSDILKIILWKVVYRTTKTNEPLNLVQKRVSELTSGITLPRLAAAPSVVVGSGELNTHQHDPANASLT